MDITSMIIAEAEEQAIRELRSTGFARLGSWELCCGPYGLRPDPSEREKYTLSREAGGQWEQVSSHQSAPEAAKALVAAWRDQ